MQWIWIRQYQVREWRYSNDDNYYIESVDNIVLIYIEYYDKW